MKYRVIQDGNGDVYLQESVFGFLWDRCTYFGNWEEGVMYLEATKKENISHKVKYQLSKKIVRVWELPTTPLWGWLKDY